MTSKLYSIHAQQYAQVIKSNLYNALFERPSLLAMLPELNQLSVLDMGCGPGVYASELLSKGARVTAVDGSVEMVAMVDAKLGEQVNAYVQDLTKGLPCESASEYDLVISPLVIHYIEDIIALFAEVARVLKPGGTFVFSTHHPMVDFEASNSGNYFATEQISQYWNSVGEQVEVSFFRRSFSELFLAIEGAGFSVSSCNEGKPLEAMNQVSESTYHRLSTKPAFIFFRCTKPG